MIHLALEKFDALDAGTWVGLAAATDWRASSFYNSTVSDQDAVSYKAYMIAGTYTCKIWGVTRDNQGILKVKIDGVTIVTWDKYAGATTRNVLNTTTGIVVATDGVKTIQLIVDGQNGSSSGYVCGLHHMILHKTA